MVIFMKLRLPILVVSFLLCGCIASLAQVLPLGLLPSPPASDDPVSAYVWTTESSFDAGDRLTIWMRVSRAAFVYLFDLSPDGVVRLLFPNVYSQANYLFPGEYALPDGPYELVARAPGGVEELLIIATDIPLPLPAGSPAIPYPAIADDPREAITGLVAMLTTPQPPPDWGIGWHAIYIQETSLADASAPATSTAPAPPTVPPFLASPGDAWYESGGWRTGIPADGWYWYFGLDGRWHLCWVYD